MRQTFAYLGPPTPTARVDGRRTTSFETLCDELERAFPGAAEIGGDLAALDAVLRGYGPTPTPLRIVWTHAAATRDALGHAETVRWLTAQLRDCPPNVLIRTAWALRAALRGTGPTLFDTVVARIRTHPNVTLVLVERGEPRGRAPRDA